jgi:hypothetical protein
MEVKAILLLGSPAHPKGNTLKKSKSATLSDRPVLVPDCCPRQIS